MEDIKKQRKQGLTINLEEVYESLDEAYHEQKDCI